MDEALYDPRTLRAFVGIDLGREPMSDETTVYKLCHLLEAHHLGDQLFTLIAMYLKDHGMKNSTGTIVGATIINAPSPTNNRNKSRDPEMHQTEKGNQWYFGMKAHIDVDSRIKLIHSVVATTTNVHDSQVLLDLLHGYETRVWGDSAYTGQGEVFDVAVNICKSSPIFGKWVGEIITAENKKQMWIPEGFAHNFVVLTDAAEFLYKTTNYWASEHDRCIVWNDTCLGVNSSIQGYPVLSGKDAQGATLKTAEVFA